MKSATAFVTGANRGIGLETARRLASPPWNFRVFLGSRAVENGEAAKWELVKTGCANVEVVQLDLDDTYSISAAVEHVRNSLGPDAMLDVFINNAAYVSYDWSVDAVRQSLRTNYRGTVAVTEAFLPLLAPGGRLIFVSSAVGKTYLVNPAVGTRMLAPDLTKVELDGFVDTIEKDVERGQFQQPAQSAGAVAYGLGKLAGTTIYPRILAQQLRSSHLVTSCCPAFGGADTPVWLATAQLDLVKDGHGAFWEQREITNPTDWQAGMRCCLARTGRYPAGHE